jgi:hypothetical protein
VQHLRRDNNGVLDEFFCILCSHGFDGIWNDVPQTCLDKAILACLI